MMNLWLLIGHDLSLDQPNQSSPLYVRTNRHPVSRFSESVQPNYSPTFEETDNMLGLENRVKQELKDLTPVSIFEKLFEEEILQ